ncbi:MAG: right-handed parallel beta-helix repeat-containing protein, partial [Nitrososphaeraceae archaeon]
MALSTEYMTINSEDRMSCNKLLEQDICMVLSLATILVVLLFSSIQNLNAAVEECISYDLADKLITLTCGSWNPSQIYSSLNNTSAMKKENDGTWLLNSNLKIWHDATFHVNSTDTKWLKINSTTPEDPYHIDVVGNMMINSVKISSWNTTSNNYTTTDGKIPRSSITVLPVASGKTDIINSEIAYLGDGNTSRGQGLSYWAGDGSLIKNNTIHHMYYAFYSEQVGNITIENNTIHDDIKYGIDPHTGTHDMIIRNNRVYDNGHIGIICSLDCNNITIDGNTVSGNTNAGIMLSRNVQDS